MNKRRFILRDQAIKDALAVYLDTLDPEPVMQVTVEEYKKNRSLSQNNLLWMWLGRLSVYLADEKGIRASSEDLKDHFQRERIGYVPAQDPVTGQYGARIKGTSELTTKEFTDFLEAIDRYAADIGLQLPHPEGLWHEAMGRAA